MQISTVKSPNPVPVLPQALRTLKLSLHLLHERGGHLTCKVKMYKIQ